jgi:hypothetical protein
MMTPVDRDGQRCSASRRCFAQPAWPQHLLNFLPEPQGHGSLRPTLVVALLSSGRGPALSDVETCLGPLWRQ